MTRKITIDPITRLEGHGTIDIFLDENRDVERALFQVPEFRGFEKFCEGRAAEEMPTLTQKICGVCPTAHHIASTKALDDLYRVTPPVTAGLVRDLMYNAFMFEDHLLHFFILSGPDFIVGPDAPRKDRNLLGMLRVLGEEAMKKVMDMRRRVRDMMALIGGSPLHPVFGLPGGVARALSEEERSKVLEVTGDAVDFAMNSLYMFNDLVLENPVFSRMIRSDMFFIKTSYMGMVDEDNRVNFHEGKIRIVDPDGRETARFAASEYLDHLEERVEDGTYMKPLFLKNPRWKRAGEGEGKGVYRVAPLARLNAAEGMSTSRAQAEYTRLFDYFGEKPVHHTLAYHWARLVEVLYAAEKMDEVARNPELVGTCIRTLPHARPEEGIGACEAPRGTLIHHYKTDERGILESVNLIVGTQNNAAAICQSVQKAAAALIKGGQASEGLLNRVEMAFRAYDPCLACATHTLGGDRGPGINILDQNGKRLNRDFSSGNTESIVHMTGAGEGGGGSDALLPGPPHPAGNDAWSAT